METILQNVMRFFLQFLYVALAISLVACNRPSKSLRNESGRLEILFLGHKSEHHNSAVFMPLLSSQLSLEGINFTYTNDPRDLNTANLATTMR